MPSPRRTDRTQRCRRLGRAAAHALTVGELTLGQLVGLTTAERAALGRAAEAHQRAGRLQQAISLHGLIAAHEPLCVESWRPLPALLLRLGEPVAADGVRAVIDALQTEEVAR